MLVDGGPPGAGLAGLLREAGAERLGGVFVTHDQSDHAGGIAELLGAVPIGLLLYGVLDRETRGAALAAGVGGAPGRGRQPAALGRPAARRRLAAAGPARPGAPPAATRMPWRW